MKTTRNTSSGKRKYFAPSGIILFMVILFSIFGGQKSFGQGVGISEVSITPNSSSILELRSTLRGFLAPRMTTTERLAIASPAQGLLVYDTSTQSFWYFETTWKTIASATLGLGNQLLGMNAGGTANEYKTLNGSPNITVTHSIGNITLNTIQDIQTISSPTFAGLTLTSPLGVPSGGTGLNSITTNNLIYGNGTGPVSLLPPSAIDGAVLTTTASGTPGWRLLNNFPAISGSVADSQWWNKFG